MSGCDKYEMKHEFLKKAIGNGRWTKATVMTVVINI